MAGRPAFHAPRVAIDAGAVYGTTEGKVHELSYARCLKSLLQGQGFRVEQEVSHAGGHAVPVK